MHTANPNPNSHPNPPPNLNPHPEQILLQCTHLRNTEWVYGVVVYTGNESKFGCNKSPQPSKMPQVCTAYKQCI